MPKKNMGKIKVTQIKSLAGIKDIHRKFGSRPLKSFPLIDILEYKMYYRYILGMKVIKPCDYVPYIKKDAEDLLNKKYGWQKFNEYSNDLYSSKSK